MTVNFITTEHVTRMMRGELERRANTLQRHVIKLTDDNRKLRRELRELRKSLVPPVPAAPAQRQVHWGYRGLLDAAMDQPSPTPALTAAIDRAIKESTRRR